MITISAINCTTERETHQTLINIMGFDCIIEQGFGRKGFLAFSVLNKFDADKQPPAPNIANMGVLSKLFLQKCFKSGPLLRNSA